MTLPAHINPPFLQLLKKPVHFLAFGFGSGLSPKAPGTAGTLVAVLLMPFMNLLSIPGYLLVLLVSTLLGIYICGKTASDMGVHDHPGIVWDEFVGLWLTMLFIPITWYWLLTGFILFRVFDILKPWPISWLDKNLSGGLGIMADDLLAGAFAWGILYSLVQLTQ